MIHKETREEQVVVQKHEVVVAITCDLCKRRYAGAEHNVNTVHWPTDGGQRDTTISFTDREFYDYGSSGNVTETTFHICPDCFANRLVPWLKKQRAEPTVKESDW